MNRPSTQKRSTYLLLPATSGKRWRFFKQYSLKSMNDTDIKISTSDETSLVEHPKQPKTIWKPDWGMVNQWIWAPRTRESPKYPSNPLVRWTTLPPTQRIHTPSPFEHYWADGLDELGSWVVSNKTTHRVELPKLNLNLKAGYRNKSHQTILALSIKKTNPKSCTWSCCSS
jgi:hypothetical protein